MMDRIDIEKQFKAISEKKKKLIVQHCADISEDIIYNSYEADLLDNSYKRLSKEKLKTYLEDTLLHFLIEDLEYDFTK